MKSATPRTDDEQFGATGRVSVDFARTLERELNAARTQLAAVRPLAQQCAEWHIGDGDECGIVARKLLALLEEEKIAELESAPPPQPEPQVQVHCRGIQNMPKETQDALVTMCKLAAKDIANEPHQPEPQQSAVDLLWESDVEVVGICKFPCVRNKKGTGIILTGQPGTEVQQLAALHNEAVKELAQRCDEAEAQVKRYDGYHSALVTESCDLRAQLAAAQAEADEMRKQRDLAGKQVLTLTAEINRLRKGITEIKAGARIGWFMTDLGAKCGKLLNP